MNARQGLEGARDVTAAEWLAAMRALGVRVFLDPRAGHERQLCLQRPVETPLADYERIEGQLDEVGRQAVYDELRREAGIAAA